MSTVLAALGPCLVAALIAYLLTTRARNEKWAEAAAALATGAGAFFGIAVLLGRAAVQPAQATDRIGLCVIAFTVLGTFAPYVAGQAQVRVAIRTAIVAALTIFLLFPPIRNSWTVTASVAWVFGATVLIAGSWQLHDAVSRREHAFVVAGTLVLVMMGASVALIFGGSAKLAQLTGAIVSAFGGAALLSVLNAQRWSLPGVIALAWPSFALMFLLGHAYSESPWLPTALLLIASTTPWLARLGTLRKRPVWQRFATTAALSGMLMAVAIGIAYRAYASSTSAYSY